MYTNVEGGFMVEKEINTLALRKRTPSFKRLDYTKSKESVVQEIKNRSEAYREPHKALMEVPTSRKLMILSNGRSGESRSKLDWGMVCTTPYIQPYIYIYEKERNEGGQAERKKRKRNTTKYLTKVKKTKPTYQTGGGETSSCTQNSTLSTTNQPLLARELTACTPIHIHQLSTLPQIPPDHPPINAGENLQS